MDESFLEILNSGNIDLLRQAFSFDFLKVQRLKGSITVGGVVFKEIPILHYSILIKRLDLFQFFLQIGFDIELRCSDWTPLHIATFLGMPKFVDLLLFHEAKTDAVNNIEIAKSLLRAGAKVDDELQPLHCAILQGNPEIVKLLLLFGADPTIKNRCGKDAFDFLKPDQENIRELLNNVKKCPPIDKNIPRIELFKPPVTTLSDLLYRLPPPRKKQESLTSIKQL